MKTKRSKRLHLKRVKSMAVAAIMLLSICLPNVTAYAEPSPDGLCVHHPQHTAECGYLEAAEAQLCTHVHDANCGYVEAVEGQPCNHVCTAESGCIVTNCVHEHDESCGYIEGVENSCTHQCTVESGCVTENCVHTHDATCGYVEAVEGQPCTHVHDETCGYQQAASASPCKYAVEGCPYCVTDWEWVDNLGVLTESDGSWGMGMPGVSEDNPLTRETLAAQLPAQILATTENGKSVTLNLTWDLTSIPEGGATAGDYTLTASLTATPENYALTEDAAPLVITAQLGGAEVYDNELTLPEGSPPYSEHIVNGVSPNGTVIDLFDYWVTTQTESDITDPEWRINKGINNGHALLFRAVKKENQGSWNVWTGSAEPETGMVKDKLLNGYPQLNVDMSKAPDKNFTNRDGNESLAYLFDPNYQHPGKESFEAVQGLLQVDKDGYYYYDSSKNYAVYYKNTNSFTLYDHPGVVSGGNTETGQFFPFNAATSDPDDPDQNPSGLMNTSKSTDASINHYFGIHMTTRFVQENGGKTANDQPVTYEFSGDDDVWIFIDDVLVADLGGIHNAASVNINFSTGIITINGVEQNKKLGNILNTGSNTLPDKTYHTLDFFYLERGNTDSNMNLKYNLVTIPESSVIKIDQLGTPVEGAEFALYGAAAYQNAQQSDQTITPIATGTTDGDGEFIFLKKDNAGNSYPITIDELYGKYQNQTDDDGNNLILVETKTPDGYRSVDEIGLYFETSKTGEVMLLSNSIWDKGAYAMPKVTATTSNSIELLSDPTDVTGGSPTEPVTLVGNGAVEKPLMFAVVFQKQTVEDQDGNEKDIWLPVSGDPINGWKVWPDSSWDSILGAAKANSYIFQVARSGAYQVEIDNLPGDIRTYYHICKDESKAKYTIGYYYVKPDATNNTTTGNNTGNYTTTNNMTLADATATNTYRIDSESDTLPLNRVFSMDLYISNIKNRLLVQKVDDEGNPVNGAEFSLYEADDVTVENGTVTVNAGATAYDSLTTTQINKDILDLNGGGIFPTGNNVLKAGEYYLVENSAPTGYKVNNTPIHIVVDETGVYADAGTTDDGVTVLRGVGSVIRSMVQFAADDDVDTTLNSIQAALATDVTYNEDGEIEWKDADWTGTTGTVLHLQYANAKEMLDYGPYNTTGDGTSTIDDVTLATDVGWSKLLIQQCYNHDGTVDTSLKTDLRGEDITKLFSGTVTVRVTNDQVGNLEVSKTVTGTEGETDRDWHFTVTLTGDGAADVDGQYGGMTFTNGVANITLQDKGSLTATNLPADLTYTVTEREANWDGYQTTSSNATGTITKGGTAEASFTNSRDTVPEKGGLAVTKYVTGTAGDTGKDWHFTVTLTGTETVNGTYGNMTFNNGVATFTLKSGETKAAMGLPAGLSYSVTETEANQNEYTTTSDGAEGTISAGTTAEATFTNHKDGTPPPVEPQTGGLKITKTVTGGGDTGKEFTFHVTLTDENGAPLTTSFSYDGSKSGTIQSGGTITLKHGESITIHEIPAGSHYLVTEEQTAGYIMTATGHTGTIPNGQTVVASFVNEWTGGGNPPVFPDPDPDPTPTPDPDPDEPDEPDEPSDPTEPDEPSGPNEPTGPSGPTEPTVSTDSSSPEQLDTPDTQPALDPNTPQTGDSSWTGLWMVLCLGSLVGMILMGAWRHHEKRTYHGKHVRK